TLSTFDGRLMDGLRFCGRVYDLLDQTRREADGITRLRLRTTTLDKRLIEELIPLARFVQSRYREGRRITVRWFAGSQPFDAVLCVEGDLVTHGMARRTQLVEITTSIYSKDYPTRQELEESGMTWGAKKISRNKRTRRIVSEPYVYSNDECATDLADQILLRLKEKTTKNYPPGTILIVNCESDGLLLQDEW